MRLPVDTSVTHFVSARPADQTVTRPCHGRNRSPVVTDCGHATRVTTAQKSEPRKRPSVGVLTGELVDSMEASPT